MLNRAAHAKKEIKSIPLDDKPGSSPAAAVLSESLQEKLRRFPAQGLDREYTMQAISKIVEEETEQRLRDVIGWEMADGTAEIMKIIISRELLGREFLPY